MAEILPFETMPFIFEQDTLPTLKSERVTMIPFDFTRDADYLYKLVCAHRFTTADEKMFRHVLELNMKFAWNVLCDGHRCGVVYFAHWKRIGWTLDGYRDESLAKSIDNKVSFSTIAAQLAMKWFFTNIDHELYTTHDVRNRAATILCRRLGFRMHSIVQVRGGQEFIILKKYGG